MTSLRQRMIEDLQVRNLAANTQDSLTSGKSRSSPDTSISHPNC